MDHVLRSDSDGVLTEQTLRSGASQGDAKASQTAKTATARSHILTVSVEDYFHGGALSQVVLHRHWDRFESRLDRNLDHTLEICRRHNATATFFVLGWTAERNPEMVRRIVAEGHEVASRGFWPRGVGGMMPDEFIEDVRRTEEVLHSAGVDRVLGYRSPRWLKREDLWVLEQLAEMGYAYDASINPILRRFAKMPEFHTVGRHAPGTKKLPLWEVPISTKSVLGNRLAIAGGNYFRQLPRGFIHRGIRKWIAQREDPLVFYFMPWEMDLEQPQIASVSGLNKIKQYRGLAKTKSLFERYMAQLNFVSVREFLKLENWSAGVGVAQVPAVAAVDVPHVVPHVVTNGYVKTATDGLAGTDVSEKPVALQDISLVVPMFNEEQSLSFLLNTVEMVQDRLADQYRIELLLVDDKSTDGTVDVAKRLAENRSEDSSLRVRLVEHDRNRGVSAAIMTGIRAAKTEIVISCDCDCTYDPHDIERMVPLLKDAEVVTASPYHPEGQVMNVPEWRLFLSRNLSKLYNRHLQIQLSTWTSCFRVYRRSFIEQIELENDGFLGIAELLIRVHRAGGRIVEFPTMLESRLLGASKMKTMGTIRGHVGLLRKVRGGKL